MPFLTPKDIITTEMIKNIAVYNITSPILDENDSSVFVLLENELTVYLMVYPPSTT